MALEIDEIGVKLAVAQESPATPTAPSEPASPPAVTPGRIQQIVSAAVQRVLASLHALRGR